LRKYELLLEIGNVGGVERMHELANIDFRSALDIWEYKLTKDPNAFGTNDVFGMLSGISESKVKAAVAGNSPLSKLIYGSSPQSCTGANLTFLASLIVGGKTPEAEEILRCVKNNPTGDFSDRMKAVVDTTFAMSMDKTGTKKAALNKKQTALLSDFISKMKTGPIKNLLTQRIKEII